MMAVFEVGGREAHHGSADSLARAEWFLQEYIHHRSAGLEQEQEQGDGELSEEPIGPEQRGNEQSFGHHHCH